MLTLLFLVLASAAPALCVQPATSIRTPAPSPVNPNRSAETKSNDNEQRSHLRSSTATISSLLSSYKPRFETLHANAAKFPSTLHGGINQSRDLEAKSPSVGPIDFDQHPATASPPPHHSQKEKKQLLRMQHIPAPHFMSWEIHEKLPTVRERNNVSNFNAWKISSTSSSNNNNDNKHGNSGAASEAKSSWMRGQLQVQNEGADVGKNEMLDGAQQERSVKLTNISFATHVQRVAQQHWAAELMRQRLPRSQSYTMPQGACVCVGLSRLILVVVGK